VEKYHQEAYSCDIGQWWDAQIHEERLNKETWVDA